MERHRTQLYLDEDQYRWLKRRARRRGSIAAVVRDLIDEARAEPREVSDDPLIEFLLEEPAACGPEPSTVRDLDEDVYG